MPLKYSLYPNPVKKDGQTYRALAKERKSSDMNDILTRMEKYHSTISRADADGTLELFFNVIKDVLLEGGVVSLPLFKAQCSISGNFKSSTDRFDKKRHTVQVKMKPGKRLKEITLHIKPERVDNTLPSPLIKSFTDLASGIQNKQIIPGSPAIIKGKHLKFDPSDPRQGIFFISENKPNTKAEIVHINTFSQLVFIIPNLEPGAYRVCVANNSLSKDIRTGELDARLLVS
jgi:hypothetical protein